MRDKSGEQNVLDQTCATSEVAFPDKRQPASKS